MNRYEDVCRVRGVTVLHLVTPSKSGRMRRKTNSIKKGFLVVFVGHGN